MNADLIEELENKVKELSERVQYLESRLSTDKANKLSNSSRSDIKNLNLPNTIGQSFGTLGVPPTSPYKAD